MPSVAIIGLGIMGSAMARNLAAAGFAVTGFDIEAAARERLLAEGIDVRSSAAEAIGDADFDLAQAGTRRGRQPLEHIAVVPPARQRIAGGDDGIQSQRPAAVIVARQPGHEFEIAADVPPAMP